MQNIIDNSDDFFVGKILGAYILQSKIGRGGMSVVYQARQFQSVQRIVAVKIFLPGAPIGSELHKQFLARFQREAQIIAGLDHMNIIPNFDYGEREGEAYLVMPYLSRGSLSGMMARQGTLSLDQARHYIEQAAAALDYAHAVIHRDLKPSNFLLHHDGRLVLADFGIAQIVRESRGTPASTLTLPGIVLGTPDYMSPELVQGQRVDPRSDIYELGIVLFQMLYGDVPFKGDSTTVLLKHLSEMPPLLHVINPAIPPAVDDVIQRATAKRPEDRFASAGDMALALGQAIETSSARPVNITALYAPTALAATGTVPANYAFDATVVERHTLARTNFSVPRPKRSRTILPMLLSVVAIVLVLAIIPLTFWITAVEKGQLRQNTTTQQSPASIQAQQAQDTVLEYYRRWNQTDYQDAYLLLSSAYRANHSYNSLLPSYIATHYSSIQIVSVTHLSPNSFNVAITDTATEEDTPGVITVHVYKGYYTATLENGSWNLYPHFSF